MWIKKITAKRRTIRQREKLKNSIKQRLKSTWKSCLWDGVNVIMSAYYD